MSEFTEGARRAKEFIEKATEAALRGDWLRAEQELRNAQLGARELRLISLSRQQEEDR